MRLRSLSYTANIFYTPDFNVFISFPFLKGNKYLLTLKFFYALYIIFHDNNMCQFYAGTGKSGG